MEDWGWGFNEPITEDKNFIYVVLDLCSLDDESPYIVCVFNNKKDAEECMFDTDDYRYAQVYKDGNPKMVKFGEVTQKKINKVWVKTAIIWEDES